MQSCILIDTALMRRVTERVPTIIDIPENDRQKHEATQQETDVGPSPSKLLAW